MSHELRLIPHNQGGEIGLQPYCVCGWIGKATFAAYCEDATTDYRAHLTGGEVVS